MEAIEGFEPPTRALQERRSAIELYRLVVGGGGGDRTHDLVSASHMLSQELSYTPHKKLYRGSPHPEHERSVRVPALDIFTRCTVTAGKGALRFLCAVGAPICTPKSPHRHGRRSH